MASGTVTPIELATNTPGAEINVAGEPEAIAITPDGKTAYVTSHSSGLVTPIELATIELATNTPGAEIKVGITPVGIAITPDGKTAYVVNESSDSVTPTALSGEGQSGGTITVKEGAAVSDEAALAGENTASATGTLTYKLYSDSRCREEVASAGKSRAAARQVKRSLCPKEPR